MIKQYEIDLDIKRSVNIVNNVELKQGDINTSVFLIRLVDGKQHYVIEDGVEVKVIIGKPDRTIIELTGSVMNGVIRAVLSEQCLVRHGIASCEVVLSQMEKKLTSTRFDFRILSSLIDEYLPSISDFRDLQKLIDEATTVTAELVTARTALSNVDDIKAEMAQLNEVTQGLINNLEAKQNEVGALVGTINTKITETESAITSLDTIRPQVDELKTLVTQAQTVNSALQNLTTTVNSANTVDGSIKSKVQVIEGWIANPAQFKGDKGDPFTYEDFTVAQIEGLKVKGDTGATGATGAAARVTATGTDANGNTTITFNDGTVVTVTKGADGTMTFEDLTPEQIASLRGIDGAPGTDGKSVEFHWNGTQLGIRKEGETSYAYVDLKGKDGVNATTTAVATPTTNGLMSKEHYNKVENIEAGAQVNAVTSVNGQTGAVITPDTTYTAGTNVTISGNTISAADTKYTAGTNVTISGNTISATDTTYGLASSSDNGLMPSAMFSKLNGLYNMVYISESAFTALGTKDPNTLYLRY